MRVEARFVDAVQVLAFFLAVVICCRMKHPPRTGTFGVYNSRVGNFTAQNADSIILVSERVFAESYRRKPGGFCAGRRSFSWWIRTCTRCPNLKDAA